MWRDYKFIVSDNYTSLLTMNRAPYKKNYKKKINSGNHFHNVLCLSEAKGMDITMTFPETVKTTFWDIIDEMSLSISSFVNNPDKDFLRRRKLDFQKMRV